MSVIGKWAVPYHGEMINQDLVMRLMSPGRRTISTASARMKYHGDSVLNHFTTKEAQSLQRLMTERYVLNAKLRALEERMEAAPQVTQYTDDMERIRLAIEDSTYEIRRVAREHTPALLALFHDPEVIKGMQLLVGSEEEAPDATGARIWRSTVGSVGHRVSSESQYRYTTHNSPDNKGNRSYTNKLETATVEDNMSYYEMQALKHGRGRRGSTSISGSWREVWGRTGEVLPAEEPRPLPPRGTSVVRGAGGTGGGGFGSSASQYDGGDGGSVASSFRDRSPSRARSVWPWGSEGAQQQQQQQQQQQYGGSGGYGGGGGDGSSAPMEAYPAPAPPAPAPAPAAPPSRAAEYAEEALRQARAYMALNK